jgi:DnaJ-class molecular chaperone
MTCPHYWIDNPAFAADPSVTQTGTATVHPYQCKICRVPGEDCGRCGGTGERAGSLDGECVACGGEGIVKVVMPATGVASPWNTRGEEKDGF